MCVGCCNDEHPIVTLWHEAWPSRADEGATSALRHVRGLHTAPLQRLHIAPALVTAAKATQGHGLTPIATPCTAIGSSWSQAKHHDKEAEPESHCSPVCCHQVRGASHAGRCVCARCAQAQARVCDQPMPPGVGMLGVGVQRRWRRHWRRDTRRWMAVAQGGGTDASRALKS